MRDPFKVFDLPVTATEPEIRNRYLQLVREHPPERAPERFAEIRAAFDSLRDPLARLEKQLFSINTTESVAGLLSELHNRLRDVRLSVDEILHLAEDS